MSFLIKITSPSKVVSHLFGTIHKNEDKFCLLSSEAKAAFEGAQVVVGEKTQSVVQELRANLPDKINEWRQTQSANGAKLGDYLSYPQLKELSALFNWGQLSFDAVQEKIEMPPMMLLQELVAKLKTSQQVNSAMGFFSAPVILDEAIMLQADTLGKQCVGLDTAEEYLACAMGEAFTYEQQVQYVHESFKGQFNLQKLKDEITRKEQLLMEVFLSGNLAQIQSAIDNLMHDIGPISGRYMEALIVGRDKLFAERLEPILKEKESFVAIGMAHLPGVIKFLQEYGFQVELVSENNKEHVIQEMKNTNAQVVEDKLVSYFKNVFSPSINSVDLWLKYSDLIQQKKVPEDKRVQFFTQNPITESDCMQMKSLLVRPGNISVMSVKFTSLADASLIGLLDNIRAKSLKSLILNFEERVVTKEFLESLHQFIEAYPKEINLEIDLPGQWQFRDERRESLEKINKAMEQRIRTSFSNGSYYRY